MPISNMLVTGSSPKIMQCFIYQGQQTRPSLRVTNLGIKNMVFFMPSSREKTYVIWSYGNKEKLRELVANELVIHEGGKVASTIAENYKPVSITELIGLIRSHFINEQIDAPVIAEDVLHERNKAWLSDFMEERKIRLII